MRTTIFSFILLVLSVGCSEKNGLNSINYTSNDCIVINYDNLKNEGHLSMSSVFQNVTPIILETREDVLIGEIDAIQVFDNQIFVLDKNSAKSLFVFSKQGDFIRKIGSFGQGPGEYVSIADFTVNQSNGDIFILDDMRKSVLKFDKTGKYIRSTVLGPKNANILYIQYVNGLLYTDVHLWKEPKERDYILQCVDAETGKQLGKYLSNSQYNKDFHELLSMNQNFFISRMNKSPKYCQPFMDTIIRIGEDGPAPFMAIASKNFITTKDIKEHPNIDDLLMFLYSASNKLVNIHSFVESSKFVLFSLYHGNRFKRILYDYETQTAHLFSSLLNDLVYKSEGFGSNFLFSDEFGAYESISSIMMPELIKYCNSGKIVETIPDFEKIRSLTEDSNPIILFYEYKK